MTSLLQATTRWKKYKRLGAGSYGTVYLAGEADSLFLSTSYAAVKSADIEHSKSVLMEAKFLKELGSNPYVVQCFAEDVSIENNKVVYNMLMEYAPGGTLDDLITAYSNAGNIIPECHAALYSFMLLKGLSHVHRKGLVHCDIKPCNILVFPSTRGDGLHHLKIADFGLAKHVWEEDRTHGLPRHRGRRVYASPESIAFGTHGTATDVWSLGCTILEMLTGRLTWTDEDMWDLFIEMVLGPSEIISELGKDFLKRCFITNPHRRWTVDMLLQHPFIVHNIKRLPQDEEIHFQNNPFGISNGQNITQHLFSSPFESHLYSFSSYQHPSKENSLYQLFPGECNSQATGGPLSIPCGVACIYSLLAL